MKIFHLSKRVDEVLVVVSVNLFVDDVDVDECLLLYNDTPFIIEWWFLSSAERDSGLACSSYGKEETCGPARKLRSLGGLFDLVRQDIADRG